MDIAGMAAEMGPHVAGSDDSVALVGADEEVGFKWEFGRAEE